jgi:hypothetical protein
MQVVVWHDGELRTIDVMPAELDAA